MVWTTNRTMASKSSKRESVDCCYPIINKTTLGTSWSEPVIMCNSTRLKVVKQFIYLGTTISDDSPLDTEIEIRIKKAGVSYGCLRDRLWQSNDISLKTQLSAYQAAVISTLLYGCGTWTCYRKHIKKLERFHTRHLKFILRTDWKELLTLTEILERYNTHQHRSPAPYTLGRSRNADGPYTHSKESFSQ